MMIGNTTRGNESSARSERRGLVTTIMATAPRPMIVLRNAIDAVAPSADLIWVASAVSLETISPE